MVRWNGWSHDVSMNPNRTVTTVISNFRGTAVQKSPQQLDRRECSVAPPAESSRRAADNCRHWRSNRFGTKISRSKFSLREGVEKKTFFLNERWNSGRKRQFSGWFGEVLSGLYLVWESATPPTHIWERSPKKRCFLDAFPNRERLN